MSFASVHFHKVACSMTGFSAAVVADGIRLLVDAGFTQSEWFDFESRSGLKAKEFNNVLLTHEHLDHMQGLSWWLQELAPLETRVWCSPDTWQQLKLPQSLEKHFSPIPLSGQFMIESVSVRAIPVTHDAIAPLAFQFRAGSDTLLLALDCGSVTRQLREALRESDHAFLSPYFDEEMLPSEPSGEAQRVASLHGHLSNQQVSAWLRKSGGRLNRLWLGHRHKLWNSRLQMTRHILPALQEDAVVEFF